jgi:hypothetical protein
MRTPMRDRRNPKSWLGLALVLAGAAACSVDPLMPGPMGGSDGGAAGKGGGGGTTAQGGTTGGGGTSGDGGAAPDFRFPPSRAVGRTVVEVHDGREWPAPSRSPAPTIRRVTAAQVAATARVAPAAPLRFLRLLRAWRGVRRKTAPATRLPAAAGLACPAVCYGTCRPAGNGPACGTVGAGGMVCCNDSCGTCTPPNGGCTKQICVPPAACARDADCRLEADLLHRL